MIRSKCPRQYDGHCRDPKRASGMTQLLHKALLFLFNQSSQSIKSSMGDTQISTNNLISRFYPQRSDSPDGLLNMNSTTSTPKTPSGFLASADKVSDSPSMPQSFPLRKACESVRFLSLLHRKQHP